MGLEPEEIERRVLDAAHIVGLSDELLEKSPFELSGGQKRRVALAGVFAMEPEVLVLDEPMAGLDPAGREDVFHYIKDYHDRHGTTVIFVTHSMLNEWAGALIGAVSGALILLVLTWAVWHFAPDLNLPVLSREALASSHIGGFICRLFS